MMFGGATDEPTAARIVARAREQGVNFIDTADGYNAGRSEEVVGRAIREHRSWWVLATKCANPTGEGPNARGRVAPARVRCRRGKPAPARRGHDRPAVPAQGGSSRRRSARRCAALADLIRAGKIRYFGVSNYRSWRVAEICRLCDEAGIDRPIASQPLYNMLNREVEVEHLPACGYFGLGAVPYSPLARGVLTGKYAAERRAAAGKPRRPPGPAHDGIRMAAGKPGDRAGDRRARPRPWHVARAFRFRLGAEQPVHHRRDRRPAHRGAVGGLCRRTGLPPDAEDEALVDRLVSPGHPSTPGYNDPQYPDRGPRRAVDQTLYPAPASIGR